MIRRILGLKQSIILVLVLFFGTTAGGGDGSSGTTVEPIGEPPGFPTVP